MFAHPSIKRRSKGFNMVEIMVGIGISLLAALLIAQVFALFEGQKRTATGGSDSLVNGGVALYSIERNIRMAGYGYSLPVTIPGAPLNAPGALGCNVQRANNGVVLLPAVLTPASRLQPVTITNGIGGLPDTISILASSKPGLAVPLRVTGTGIAPGAAPFTVNSTLGMVANDFLVAYQNGFCTLMQVTPVAGPGGGIPAGGVTVLHANAGSIWNPATGSAAATAIFPVGGYSSGATVFNLGAIVQNTYSLDADSNLVLTSYNSQTNANVVQPLAANVVSLQAQYGFDTRPGAQTDGVVGAWSDVMIDADGLGVAGDSGDVARIYAIRLALVTRSAVMEKPKTNGTCDITTATSVNAPRWTDGTAIDVSNNPNGTPNANWQCYRYKVFETVVPVRNMFWRER